MKLSPPGYSHHVQFASILLQQCCLEGDEDQGEKNGIKPPLWQNNDALPVDVDALHDDAQANNDATAGLDSFTIVPQLKQQPRRNNAALIERHTVINPVTMLPNHSCKGCINGLQHRVAALELGVRDDVFATEDDIEDYHDDDEEGGFDFDTGEHHPSPTPHIECIEDNDARRKGGGRVRFHDDTKGSSPQEAMSTSEFDANNSNNDRVKSSQLLCKHMKVRVYRPQRCDVGCPLGITLFYLTVYMGERTFLSRKMEVDGQKALTSWNNCLSGNELGLDIAVQNASGSSSGDRVILLIAVELSNPACHLSSASSVSVRLRDCMTKLVTLDLLNLGKMSKRGNGSNSLTSQVMRQQDQHQAMASQVNHHMALLATLVDDSGGLMQDDDNMNLRSSATMSSAEISVADSTGNRGGSGVIRKKLFTFSLSKGRPVEVQVSSDNVSRQIIEGADYHEGGMLYATNADIIQGTAQRLELLSIIEDEMLLPKYSHAAVVGGGRKASAIHSFARFPWRSYVGGVGVMGALSATGRYGRPPAIFELSSFEYCPSLRRRQATVTTASMSLIDSDEFSMMTGGDETSISTVVSRSLVPMLTKSRRDFSSPGSIETSRSRFLQRKRRDKTTSPGADELTMAQQATLRPLPQTIYDPFRIDDNFNDYEESDKNLSDDNIGAFASISTDEIAIPSNNHTTSEGIVLSQTPTSSKSAAMTLSEQGLAAFEPATEDEVEMPASIGHTGYLDGNIASNEEYARYLDVGLALNEDLTCEYYNSKLSSLFVDGTVQVSVKTTYKQEPSPHQRQQPATPFTLICMDHSGHIKALQENKKFVRHITQGSISTREFAYHISVPREEEYFPVLRYKCGTALRPVPIRVQSRVKAQGDFCRVALQISSNPLNQSDLVNLTIIMSVPDGVLGETLLCNPPGGVWNASKRIVLWCVSELAGGEKFQLLSIFELENNLKGSIDLEFPVLARCQCSGVQLSNVALEVNDIPDHYSAKVSKTLAQRFRVSHKEFSSK